MSDPTILIDTHNLVKRFGDKLAVNNVTFEVHAGEVFGFLGPNGAGKTTTIKIIVGLLQPTSGTVRVAGYDVQTQSLEAKAASGYVPDTPNLYAKLTGRELLRFVGELYNLERGQVARRIDELLRVLDLAAAADDTVNSYSHGMQQKASLAAALMHDPKVLVLDEPTVGLDPKSARLIKDILRQMADRGAAVFLSTHILEIAERMCDRIGIINNGELIAVGHHGRTAQPGQKRGDQPGRHLPQPDRRGRGSRDCRNPEMNQTPLPLSRRLLPSIGKLIRLRLRITFNTFKHARTRRKIVTVVISLALVAFAGGIFFLSWLLLNFLRSPDLARYVPINPAGFLETVPVLILAGLFLGILFSSFGVLLQALYLAGDMDFLLSSPVPIRAVFITKLLQAVLPNFGLIALFGLPVLFGLGASGHYNFLYYPLVLLVMITLTLAAAGLASLLVMLVARLFPARRVAEVLGFLTATLTILCSQIFNLTQSFGHTANISNTQVLAMLNRLNTPWLPLNWAGRGLVALGEGRWLSGILLVALTLGICAVAFWFSLATAERWYYTGWAGMQVVARRKKRPPSVRPGSTAQDSSAQTASASQAAAVPPLGRVIPAPVHAILVKDFLVMRRDLRSLSQLITPLIFGVVYTVYLLQGGRQVAAGRGSAPDAFMNSLQSLLVYGNVAISLFVGMSLLSRLAGMSFSAEGRNYWLLKASPVRAGDLLLAKFLVAYLPAFALGLFFLIGTSLLQGSTMVVFLYNLLAVAFCLAGMNGLLLAFGVAGANFKWEDPRRMNSGAMGCLGGALAMLFLVIDFALFVGPLWLVTVLPYPQFYAYLAGLVLGIGASLVATVLPPVLMRGRVSRLGEG